MAAKQQLIFGYGSLVESQSRARTSLSALYAAPANAGISEDGLPDRRRQVLALPILERLSTQTRIAMG